MRLIATMFMLTACTGSPGDTEDTDACPVLLTSVDEVVFANANLNQQTHGSLKITNDCIGFDYLELAASLQGDEVFTLKSTSLTVPPTGSGMLDLEFFSTDRNPHRAELVLTPRDMDPVSLVVWGMVGTGSTEEDRDADGHLSLDYGGDDCDDYDPAVYPGAEEVWYDGADQDCAGDDDFDQDGDGYRHVDHGGADCDDQQPGSNPDMGETSDLLDNDCDGLVDEDWIDAGDLLVTEVMLDPAAVADDAGQWLEVYNLADHAIDLVGMELVDSDGGRQTIKDSLVVLPGAYAVLGASDVWADNGGVYLDYAWNANRFSLAGVGTSKLTMDAGSGEVAVFSLTLDGSWCVQSGQATGLSADRLTRSEATESHSWCLSTATLPFGDRGSPGEANQVCPPWDDDGDSYLHPLHCGPDCDDSDPAVNPSGVETWGNGSDDDCDGDGDDALITDIYDGYVEGDGVNQRLGYTSNLGLGDVDNDGHTELIVGAIYGTLDASDGDNEYEGGAWIIEAEDGLSAAGSIDAVDEARVAGAYTYNYLGVVGAWSADNDGDGLVDLFLGGQDALGSDEGNVAGALFHGPIASGALSITDADLTLTGSLSHIKARVHSGLDLDDDGVAELVYGESEVFFAGGDADNYRGRVALIDASGLSGTVNLSTDADLLLEGDDRADYLGSSLGGADLDGDGHDDLAIGAWGDSDRAANSGAVYWVFGDATLPEDGHISDVADLIIQGNTAGSQLGAGPEPQVGDVDGDGTLDLVLAAHEAHAVYVFLDAGTLSGTVHTAMADHVINASPSDLDGDGMRDTPDDFGCGLAVGDLDGDGIDDLAIGAPDDDTHYPSYLSEVEGQVFLFFGGTLSGIMSAADAGSVVTGRSVGDAFGQSLLTADLDGNGTEDLVIDAPGEASDQGRVYMVALPMGM